MSHIWLKLNCLNPSFYGFFSDDDGSWLLTSSWNEQLYSAITVAFESFRRALSERDKGTNRGPKYDASLLACNHGMP